MTIICSSYSTSISGSNSLVCGYAIKVYDIKPSLDYISIQIDDVQFMSVYTGYSAIQYGTVIFSLHLVSKNTSNGTAVIDMVVSDNPCNGITCPDVCVGNYLYTQRCSIDYDSQNIPTGYTCVPDILKTPNTCSLATHYIEYDFSHLSTEFNNWLINNITTVSNRIFSFISSVLPSNISYINSTFTNTKFRIYIQVTGLLSYPTYNFNIQTLDIWQTLTGIAKIIAGTLTFVVGLLIDATVLGLPLGVIISALGVSIVTWGIYDIATSTSSTESISKPSPADEVKAVKEYIETYLSPDCDALWTGCAATPPTCDAGTMRAYLGCVGPSRWAQCQHAKAKAGLPLTDCDVYKTEIQTVDTGLADGTLTPEQAKNIIINNVINPVKADVETIITNIECPGQTYDRTLKECVDVCWIQNPFGGCLLSAKTGTTLLYITAGLTVGYIGYKIFVKK